MNRENAEVSENPTAPATSLTDSSSPASRALAAGGVDERGALHSLHVREAGDYDVAPERVLNGADISELLFRSQFDPLAVTKNSPYPMEGLFGVDLTPRLGEITLPVLVLWGIHDLATPYAQAEPGLAAYGAPADQKRLVAFDDSVHNPWAEEPERFYEEVRGFLGEVWPDLP